MLFSNPRVYRDKETGVMILHLGYAYDYEQTNFANGREVPDLSLLVIGGRVVVTESTFTEDSSKYEFLGGTSIPTI